MSNNKTPQQAEKKKKMQAYILYGVLGLIAILLFWFVFTGFEDETAQEGTQKAVKTELPIATPDELPVSKVDVYEEEYYGYLSDDNQRTVADMDIVSIAEQERKRKEEETARHLLVEQETQNSIMAAQKLIDEKSNSQEENTDFPNDVATITALDKSAKMIEAEQQKAEIEAQLEILRTKQELENEIDAATIKNTVGNEDRNNKSSGQTATIMPVKQKNNNVTVLRRNSFSGTANERERKTIKAIAYGKQVVKTDQNVRLRLSEPMLLGNIIIPKNTIVTGACNIGTDRLYINITNIQYNDIIYPVSLTVYDLDGMRGLYVPGSLENDAIKEVSTEVANSIGSSAQQVQSNYINNQSATEQMKADIYRGSVGGLARYVEKKLSEIKVSIQDGQMCYLMF